MDGATPTFVTNKLSMPRYPIGLAEMPSKTTFPVNPNAKINVPVIPDKDMRDFCNTIQEYFIEHIEADKANVSFSLSRALFFSTALLLSFPPPLLIFCSGKFLTIRAPEDFFQTL
jgi:hypothetical protein